MDYLTHAFFDGGDAIVWANRCGGKTMLGAVATLLDCVFKPRCHVRILGGSRDQSGRMYEHLTSFLDSEFGSFVDGQVTRSSCGFDGGSTVEILAQSPRSVRGRHVQKLRCDEVEEFAPHVLSAAKFITQSKHGIPASMELLSTMHKPYGLMSAEVKAAEAAGTRVFKWCLWEVIEKCADRNCSQCPLSDDCRGRAKEADGYFLIDDAIQHMRRASRAAWEAEMLCLRPSLDNAVFADFDPAIHVGRADYDPALPLYRSIDFGFVNPFVCLWIQEDAGGVTRVINEYVRSRATIHANIEVVKSGTMCHEERVAATYCDPAGAGASDVTGTSPVDELIASGIFPKYRASRIGEGIECIRRTLLDGQGRSRMVISPRCVRLIEALQCYHYADGSPKEIPVKDGIYDHPIDALRYYFVNRKHSGKMVGRGY